MFPERKPGLIAAKALNAIGKAVAIKIDPMACKDQFFSWPWCYFPGAVESCSECEMLAD
jgi:hypothetical protein